MDFPGQLLLKLSKELQASPWQESLCFLGNWCHWSPALAPPALEEANQKMEDHKALGWTQLNLSVAWEKREIWTVLAGKGTFLPQVVDWAGAPGCGQAPGRRKASAPWCIWGQSVGTLGGWEDHEQE